jgi:hypothetical protein
LLLGGAGAATGQQAPASAAAYAAALRHDSVAVYLRGRRLIVDTVVRQKDKIDGTTVASWPEVAVVPAAGFAPALHDRRVAFGSSEGRRPGTADSVFAVIATSGADSSSFLLALLGGGGWTDVAICRFRVRGTQGTLEFVGCVEP